MRRRDPEQLTNVRGLYVDELVVNLDSAPAGWPATVTTMQSALPEEILYGPPELARISRLQPTKKNGSLRKSSATMGERHNI